MFGSFEFDQGNKQTEDLKFNRCVKGQCVTENHHIRTVILRCIQLWICRLHISVTYFKIRYWGGIVNCDTLTSGSRATQRSICLWLQRVMPHYRHFLDAFAKLRNAANSIVMCPSVRMEAPTGRILIKFDTLSIFRRSVAKIEVSLQSHINRGYFTWRPKYVRENQSILLTLFRNLCRLYESVGKCGIAGEASTYLQLFKNI
jgi:hypothetical protein